MKIAGKSNMVGLESLSCILLLIGFSIANAVPYDYTASIKCLAIPQKPQYNGGIIQNPELNGGLKGWSTFGDAKIKHKKLQNNYFVVAHSRVHSYDSVSQKLVLQKDKIYTFSAWIQVSKGKSLVSAVVKTQTGSVLSGYVYAESNCWSMLKGGFTVDTSGSAQLYFESKDTSVDIWVDSISLQPFTEEEWTSHQNKATEKFRKAKVRIQAVDSQGKPLSNAAITVEQKKARFPVGCAINNNILSNQAYQKWFTSRFAVTVFENEMKWYSTENTQGKVNYSVPDAMLQFAKKNNIQVRGHNVFWDDPTYQQGWIKSLSSTELFKASKNRINSLMSRYKGEVIAWDVVNENMHFNFFESKLGNTASAVFYNMAQKIDTSTTLFLNEFNTIEDGRDYLVIPAKYVQKLKEIQAYPGNRNLRLGIGLESHFSGSAVNLAYMRASIDILASTNFPIWLTEVDVKSSPNQAKYLEQILREAYSHPKVSGIMIWSAWKPDGCYRMCLTDNNFRNLPTGDVVDKLLAGGFATKSLSGRTDGNGFFEASLAHGDYIVKINNPSVKNSSLVQNINVGSSPAADRRRTMLVRFDG